MEKQIINFNTILSSYKIGAVCTNYKRIDNYFFYDLKLVNNGTIKNLIKYVPEITLSLKAPALPIIKTLHSKGLIRLEFAENRSKRLDLLDYFSNENIPKYQLPCLLGQGMDGSKVWMDLAQNPHLLIAGTTGSGKSGLMHNIIANLFNYNNVNLFLMDPKNIEFSLYKDLPNTTVAHTYQECLLMLENIYQLMNIRYENIRAGKNNMKYVILMIDEFADLIMQDKDNVFYTLLCQLVQKCRAAKINIVLATQRPSVDVINGTIKANFPARIACRVSSHIDSRVILDSKGAENLLGKGDGLLKDHTRNLERLQIAYITPEEVYEYWKK